MVVRFEIQLWHYRIFLTSIKNEDEVITVDGFYDGAEQLSEKERELIGKVEGEDYVTFNRCSCYNSEKGYTAKEHTMASPTFEINGIYGGYQGEGTKTIIPNVRNCENYMSFSSRTRS